jgi:prepilin-type N-terminal cleavage/methylation domain
MKSSKGFTLVEIIGVIAVIAVIALVTAPQVLKTMKQQDDSRYNDFLKDLYLSAEMYIIRNQQEIRFSELTDPGDTVNITVGELIDAGLVKSKTTNPKRKTIVNRNWIIKATVNSKKTFTFVLED